MIRRCPDAISYSAYRIKAAKSYVIKNLIPLLVVIMLGYVMLYATPHRATICGADEPWCDSPVDSHFIKHCSVVCFNRFFFWPQLEFLFQFQIFFQGGDQSTYRRWGDKKATGGTCGSACDHEFKDLILKSLRPGRHTSFKSYRFLIRPILASKTTILGLQTPIPNDYTSVLRRGRASIFS